MKDSKNNKNKKGIIILGGLSLLGVLGGTLAYFTTTTNIANKFKSGMYQNEIVEKFESPANWTPGTVTEKKISVKNTGNIPMAVRASYTEKWVSASGKELNLAPIVIDEITVLGSRCGQFPPALRLLKNHKIDFTPFINGIYSIDDAIEAFEANKSRENLKILIKM